MNSGAALGFAWIVVASLWAITSDMGSVLTPWAAVASGVVQLGIAAYPIPGTIASWRRHPNATAIWALNLLGGWTGLGWIAALVWALTDRGSKP